MKKRNFARVNLFLLLSAGAFFFAGGVLSLFPAPAVSESENRTLAAFPTLDRRLFFEGVAGEKINLYLTERHPARAFLRRFDAVISLLREGESHGVLLCRDGSLMRRPTPNFSIYEKNLRVLRTLSARVDEAGKPLSVCVLPRRVDAAPELLPPYYDKEGDRAVWETLRSAVPHALTFPSLYRADLWYRTDHHWQSDGAYICYRELCALHGITPYEDFTRTALSAAFLGTADAAAGLPRIAPDTIFAYRFAGDADFCVTRDGNPADFAGLYDEAKLNTRDGYAVFLGGNCGVLTVDAGEDDARETLLLVRDSFADALIPFLARHFRVVAVDPRYAAVPFSDMIARADRVLVLCGMQTLSEVDFLTPLLRAK